MPLVHHQSIKLNWITPTQIHNPKTLVLGSFNPFNPNETNQVDYYYGRSSNYFWQRIGIIIENDPQFFFHQEFGLNRKRAIMKDRFACLDVIDSINFFSSNGELLNQYIDKNVLNGFLDQAIWGQKILKGKISLSRNYNLRILETLLNVNTIEKVIHTMGNNRISKKYVARPCEHALKNRGFNGFVSTISQICQQRNIHFETISFSPSGYAVRNGRTNLEELDEWLINNLNLSIRR